MSEGRNNKMFLPFTMKNVRHLPIVGDVHLSREQWPSDAKDWQNLWSIQPLPIKLSKIIYSVNEQEKAFTSISLHFQNQGFESFELAASNNGDSEVCQLKLRKSIATVKIKQRNTTEGVSKICGL